MAVIPKKMYNKIVLIKGTKERLEIISKDGDTTTIRNSSGIVFVVPSIYLITLQESKKL